MALLECPCPSLPFARSLGRSETPPSSSFPMSPLSRVWERQLDTLCLFSLHFSPATFSLVVVSVRLFCRNQCDLRTHFSSTWVSPKSMGKYYMSTPEVSRHEFRRHADKTPSRISDCRKRRRRKGRGTTKRRPAENPPPLSDARRRPNPWPWRGRWQRTPSSASWSQGTHSSMEENFNIRHLEQNSTLQILKHLVETIKLIEIQQEN